MGIVADVLFAATVPVGLAVCLLGVFSARRGGPGAQKFGAFLVGWGMTPLISTVLNLFTTQVGLIVTFLWCGVTVPWVLFALQYTGTRVGRGTFAAVTVPLVGLVPWLAQLGAVSTFAQTVGTLVFIYYAGAAVAGAALVLRATAQYGHIPTAQGATVATAGVLPPLVINGIGLAFQFGNPSQTEFGAVFLLGVGGVGVAAWTGLARYRMFDATPAPGRIGSRTLASVTDDLVLITDREGRLVETNEATDRALAGPDANGAPSSAANDSPTPDVSDPSPDALTAGQTLQTAIGHGLGRLRDADTIDLNTATGTRTFDPAVTPLSDETDPRGYLVSLHDVTERELRRQRLEVLNRVVRHNVRNRATVIKSNADWAAETVEDDAVRDRLQRAIAAADSLTRVSRRAKRVESLLSRTGDTTTTFEPATVAQEVVAQLRRNWPGATVTRGAVADGRYNGDRAAVAFVAETLAVRALDRGEASTVELAITVDESRSVVEVTSDGCGVSQREIDVVASGHEDPLQHASGVALWAADWAVTDAGGSLSFHDDGTRVRAEFPILSVTNDS